MTHPQDVAHDDQMERALLGGLLQDPSQFAVIRDMLTPKSWHKPQHRRLWAMLCEFADTGGYDFTVVLSRVAEVESPEALGGIMYVVALPNACPAVESLELYAEKLRAIQARREVKLAMMGAMVEIDDTTKALPDVLSPLLAHLQGAESVVSGAAPAWIGAGIADRVTDMEERVAMFREAQRTGIAMSAGVTFGVDRLDAVIGGLLPGDLCIVAARPAVGKTAFALGAAFHAARLGRKVGIWSYEMSREQLQNRLICYEARLPTNAVRVGDLTDRQRDDYHAACEVVASLPIRLGDGRPTLSQLRGQARTVQREGGMDLVIVDYLQLMPTPEAGRNSNREQAVAGLSRGLKLLGGELEMAMMVLSQLNRASEGRTDKRPVMADLRESGAIEQDADQILGLYRGHVHDETIPEEQAEIGVLKNRDGVSGDWIGALWRGGRFL